MAERPWMPMYWGDYLADTQHLSTAQHGAYLLLIAAYWCSGKPLPGNHAELARIARVSPKWWTQNRDCILQFFSLTKEGAWRHKRLDKELFRSSARSAAASANAKRKRSIARATPQPDFPLNTLTSESKIPDSENHNTPHQAGNGKKPPPEKGTRLREDWKPSEAAIAYCRNELGCSTEILNREYAAFMDWGLSATGPPSRKRNWDRAFVNWMRRVMNGIREQEARERRRAEAWRQAH